MSTNLNNDDDGDESSSLGSLLDEEIPGLPNRKVDHLIPKTAADVKSKTTANPSNLGGSGHIPTSMQFIRVKNCEHVVTCTCGNMSHFTCASMYIYIHSSMLYTCLCCTPVYVVHPSPETGKLFVNEVCNNGLFNNALNNVLIDVGAR